MALSNKSGYMQPRILISNHGQRFSYYENDNFKLGSGAMGTVYKGWRTHHPEQKVAIKLVNPRHAEHPVIRERAKHESTLVFDNPNIIRMLGYCEPIPQRGPIYIISELINGTNIDEFAKTLPWDIRTEVIIRMMCAVLDGLACLHTKRVWHRDIKPSNIMVEDGINVKIMDLGIARTDGKAFGTSDRAFGTFAYAPPEQISRAYGEVNHLSDIYSTGVTFYELLTGVNPYETNNDVETMDRQIAMTLPYDQYIPKPLYKVLLKATAKRQTDRYQSVHEFKRAVLEPSMPATIRQWELIVIIAGTTILIFFLLFLFLS